MMKRAKSFASESSSLFLSTTSLSKENAMNTRTRTTSVLTFAIAVMATLALAADTAHAATITWNGTTVTHMANDGVAANNFAQLIAGKYVDGGHVFADDGDLGGTYVVNDTVGSRSLSFVQLANPGGPFGADAVNTGDANFDNILSGGNNFGPYTVTLGGVNALTIGTTYTVQLWSHAVSDSTYKGGEAVGTIFTGQVAFGGNPDTGNSITDNPWFVTGTFKADATTQDVLITSGGNVGFDAYLVTGPPTAPEPSTFILAAFSLVGLMGTCCRRRNR